MPHWQQWEPPASAPDYILVDSFYRKDENYTPKVFLEKYNFNDSYNVDSVEEHSDDSDDSYEKSQMKKIPMKKILLKKIKSIDLYLEKTSKLISSHPKMLENFYIEI